VRAVDADGEQLEERLVLVARYTDRRAEQPTVPWLDGGISWRGVGDGLR
jgi:hypothetical protein